MKNFKDKNKKTLLYYMGYEIAMTQGSLKIYYPDGMASSLAPGSVEAAKLMIQTHDCRLKEANEAA